MVTAGLTTWLGWWRPVMREKPVGVKWMWSIPVVLGLLVLIGVDWAQISVLGAPYLLLLALGTLLVGFNEEIVIAACQWSHFARSTRRCTCGS